METIQQQYQRDGFVFLPKLLDQPSLDRVVQAYDWMLAHPDESHVKFYPKEDATFLQAAGYSVNEPAFQVLLQETPVGQVCSELFANDDSPGDVWYLGEQLFLKEGGAARRTPWHQDSSYLAFEGEKLAVVWITLDPLPKEACLEVIPGSHHGITYNGSMFDPKDDTAPLYPNADMKRLPDIEAERDQWDIRSFAIEPGDVLIFHTACLHGGAATTPELRRRTLSLRFFGDDVTWVKRPMRIDKMRDERSSDGRGYRPEKAGQHLYDSPGFKQVVSWI